LRDAQTLVIKHKENKKTIENEDYIFYVQIWAIIGKHC